MWGLGRKKMQDLGYKMPVGLAGKMNMDSQKLIHPWYRVPQVCIPAEISIDLSVLNDNRQQLQKRKAS